MFQAIVGLLGLISVGSASPGPAEVCNVMTPDGGPWRPTVTTTREMVRQAEVIVRVQAVEVDRLRTGERRTVAVRFRVLEVMEGEHPGRMLTFRGWPTEEPDFNPDSVPYVLVRPEGRGGFCYALAYQRGGEFLLMLKEERGRLTPYWAPLRPVNEQIRGRDDPWVRWVREELSASLSGESRRPPGRRWNGRTAGPALAKLPTGRFTLRPPTAGLTSAPLRDSRATRSPR